MSGVWASQRSLAKLSWAELMALDPAKFGPDQVFYVSDLGVGGSFWYSSGTRWRAQGGAVWLANLASDVAHDGTVSQLKLAETSLPVKAWQNGDILETHVSRQASAGGSTASVVQRLGTAGSTADTNINNMSQPAGSNLNASWFKRHKRLSATSIQMLDVTGAGGLGGSSTANLLASTVANLDSNATKVGLYLAEGTGGVRICTLKNYALRLFTCGA